MAICVYIATIQGPVAVRGITLEEDLFESVMCLDGQTGKVAVSRQYDEFVRRGSGIIARRVGHDCFRVDVEGQIDRGDSWQLAMTAAHDVQAAGQFAESLHEADLLLWATGAVNVKDSTVQGVASVSRKFEKSMPLFQEARARGIPVIALYPDANVGDLQLPAELHGLDAAEMQLMPVAHIDELPELLQLPVAAAAAESHPPQTVKFTLLPATASRWPYALVAIVTAVLIAGGIWQWRHGDGVVVATTTAVAVPARTVVGAPQALLNAPRAQLNAPQVVLGAQHYILNVFRSSKPGSCAQNYLLPPRSLTADRGDVFATTALTGVCELSLVATENGAAEPAVYLLALDAGLVKPLRQTGHDQSPVWHIPLPENQSRDRHYALAVTEPGVKAEAAIREVMSKAPPIAGGAVRRALAVAGGDFVVLEHTLEVDW